MSFSKRGLGAILAASTVVSACSGVGFVLAPSGQPADLYQATGMVRDDSCLLPDGPGADSCLPLAGARVEVLSGPEKGRVAITGPDGKYDLGLLTQNPVVCVIACASGPTGLSISMTGWITASTFIYPGSNTSTNLGQAPHVLWGLVELPGGPSEHAPAVGVRVVITGGPLAGREAASNDAGIYRFDNLPTVSVVDLEFSKEGFPTQRWTLPNVRQNMSFQVRLKAQ